MNATGFCSNTLGTFSGAPLIFLARSERPARFITGPVRFKARVLQASVSAMRSRNPCVFLTQSCECETKLRKLWWENHILSGVEDIGETASRFVRYTITAGQPMIISHRQKRES